MRAGVFHDHDLDRDGKRLSHIGIPFSVDRSPYFQVKVPICVSRNSDGPFTPTNTMASWRSRDLSAASIRP